MEPRVTRRFPILITSRQICSTHIVARRNRLLPGKPESGRPFSFLGTRGCGALPAIAGLFIATHVMAARRILPQKREPIRSPGHRTTTVMHTPPSLRLNGPQGHPNRGVYIFHHAANPQGLLTVPSRTSEAVTLTLQLLRRPRTALSCNQMARRAISRGCDIVTTRLTSPTLTVIFPFSGQPGRTVRPAQTIKKQILKTTLV